MAAAGDRGVEPRAADERATLPRFVSIARPPVQRSETAPWHRERAVGRAPERPMPRAEGSTPPPMAEVAAPAGPAVMQPEPTTRPGTQPRRAATEPARPVALRADTSPIPDMPAGPLTTAPPAGTPRTARGHERAPGGPTMERAAVPERVGSETDAVSGSGALQRPRILANRYRLERRIAEGGFGTVYSALDTRLSKPVAVKVLSPMVSNDREHLERFCREAVAASMIGHEGIVNVTDFDRELDGTHFIVMELLDGQDLSQVIEAEGALPVERALNIAVQIASALDGAHQSSVLHRDLKPANVFLIRRSNRRDVVKIVDFGISKVLDPRFAKASITLNGQVVGTPYYMAPEQAQGRTDLDARVDVYALGVIFYEMLVGEPPLTGADCLAAVVNRNGPPVRLPSQRRAGLWPGLDRIAMKALSRDREARYPSMASFGAALLRELESINPIAATLVGGHPGWVVTDREQGGGIAELFGGVTMDVMATEFMSPGRSMPEGTRRLGTARLHAQEAPLDARDAIDGAALGSSLDPYDAETVNGRPMTSPGGTLPGAPSPLLQRAATGGIASALSAASARAQTPTRSVTPPGRRPGSQPSHGLDPRYVGLGENTFPEIEVHMDAPREAAAPAIAPTAIAPGAMPVVRAPRGRSQAPDLSLRQAPDLPLVAQRLLPPKAPRPRRLGRALFIIAAVLLAGGMAVMLGSDRSGEASAAPLPTAAAKRPAN